MRIGRFYFGWSKPEPNILQRQFVITPHVRSIGTREYKGSELEYQLLKSGHMIHQKMLEMPVNYDTFKITAYPRVPTEEP